MSDNHHKRKFLHMILFLPEAKIFATTSQAYSIRSVPVKGEAAQESISAGPTACKIFTGKAQVMVGTSEAGLE
jgi:hypothetical protein